MPFTEQPRNLLLANLAEPLLAELHAKLTYTEFLPGESLAEVGEPVDWVVFPEAGLISIVALSTAGQPVEVATIGKEGFFGVNVALDVDRADHKRAFQTAGCGWKMSAPDFKSALQENHQLREIINRYIFTLLHLTEQTVLCNSMHKIDPRCARWLLFTQDRSNERKICVAQELIAMMLGARRATINTTLASFSTAGMVRLKRGSIEIVDREKLERISCPCYSEAKEFYRQTMGFPMH